MGHSKKAINDSFLKVISFNPPSPSPKSSLGGQVLPCPPSVYALYILMGSANWMFELICYFYIKYIKRQKVQMSVADNQIYKTKCMTKVEYHYEKVYFNFP